MDTKPSTGTISTSSLDVSWSEAPWDSVIVGTPVLQITQLSVFGAAAKHDFRAFERARDSIRCALANCRLTHDRLRESMFLEERGFRFIEMMYRPVLDLLSATDFSDVDQLEVLPGSEGDLPELLDIAGHAFRNERFHVDPRLPRDLCDRRYCSWVRSAMDHPSQRLQVLRANDRIAAFFVTERLPSETVYWHLNAVSPALQGSGLGRRAWVTMLRLARTEGATRVETCIAARNFRVLNLYARLGFRFPPPLMTFHWVRE